MIKDIFFLNPFLLSKTNNIMLLWTTFVLVLFKLLEMIIKNQSLKIKIDIPFSKYLE